LQLILGEKICFESGIPNVRAVSRATTEGLNVTIGKNKVDPVNW